MEEYRFPVEMNETIKTNFRKWGIRDAKIHGVIYFILLFTYLLLELLKYLQVFNIISIKNSLGLFVILNLSKTGNAGFSIIAESIATLAIFFIIAIGLKYLFRILFNRPVTWEKSIILKISKKSNTMYLSLVDRNGKIRETESRPIPDYTVVFNKKKNTITLKNIEYHIDKNEKKYIYNSKDKKSLLWPIMPSPISYVKQIDDILEITIKFDDLMMEKHKKNAQAEWERKNIINRF